MRVHLDNASLGGPASRRRGRFLPSNCRRDAGAPKATRCTGKVVYGLQSFITLVKLCQDMSVSFSRKGVFSSFCCSERLFALPFLSSKTRIFAFCSLFSLIFALTSSYGQNYVRQGAQFPVTSPLVGDQVYPALGLRPGGGFIVWQDNITDGDGIGISARRLDTTLSGSLSVFRVNAQGANDQENP